MRNVSTGQRITNTVSSIYHWVPTPSPCTCPTCVAVTGVPNGAAADTGWAVASYLVMYLQYLDIYTQCPPCRAVTSHVTIDSLHSVTWQWQITGTSGRLFAYYSISGGRDRSSVLDTIYILRLLSMRDILQRLRLTLMFGWLLAQGRQKCGKILQIKESMLGMLWILIDRDVCVWVARPGVLIEHRFATLLSGTLGCFSAFRTCLGDNTDNHNCLRNNIRHSASPATSHLLLPSSD